jgi:hypothetical protein
MEWEVPLFPQTPLKKFWPFEYNIEPMLGMLASLPGELASEMENAATDDPEFQAAFDQKEAADGLDQNGDSQVPFPGSSSLEESVITSSFNSKPVASEINAGQSNDEVLFGSVRVDFIAPEFRFSGLESHNRWRTTLGITDGQRAAAWPAGTKNEGFLVPFAQMDLLRVMLYDLHHARRRRLVRYVRMWSGSEESGGGVLVRWSTERVRGRVSSACIIVSMQRKG